MKITTPEEKEQQILNSVSEYVEQFEKLLSEKNSDEEYYQLTIYEDLDYEKCNIIEQLYTNAGWKSVECKSEKLHSDSYSTTLTIYKKSKYF